MTRQKLNYACAFGLMAIYSAASCWASQSGKAKLHRVSQAQLCVTEGAIEELPDHQLSVAVPKMRAYVDGSVSTDVEARFTYLGSTGNEARLGSGELRRQFGLKLRAQDACNLVYAMWRIEPESKLVVSIKSNPGQHTSAECGNRGYRNVKPRVSKSVPVLHSGAAHTLRAELKGSEMKVFVDNAVVWDGSIGADGLRFDGPVGIRSDNARLKLELLVEPRLDTQHNPSPGCRSGSDEGE